LKAVNSAGAPHDPQLLFLLMAQYANGNLQREGVDFPAARSNEFGPRLTDPQKALYLSAIGPGGCWARKNVHSIYCTATSRLSGISRHYPYWRESRRVLLGSESKY
jgi:hypothetical protein